MGRKKQLSRRPEPERRIVWPRWTGFRGKTVWDFLQLLIVPLMLVAIGLVFSLQQDARQQRVEDQRAEAERKLAQQRAQDEALQAYLNQMSQLMLERKLLEAEQGDPFHADPVYTLAQARTSTVILRLDAEHNASVIRFLSDSGLAWSARSGSGTFVIAADSGGPPPASVSLLRGITLNRADLSGAGSSGAFVLDHVDLSYADLSGAEHITNEELEQQASFLEDATMPNDQKYEDWLKDREKHQQDD